MSKLEERKDDGLGRVVDRSKWFNFVGKLSAKISGDSLVYAACFQRAMLSLHSLSKAGLVACRRTLSGCPDEDALDVPPAQSRHGPYPLGLLRF